MGNMTRMMAGPEEVGPGSASSGRSEAERQFGSRDVLLLVVLAGVAATFIHGYRYGQMNQMEHIPRILRMMNPGYLAGDFVVDATSGYGPRFFYSLLMAGFARLLTLPGAFLLLACVQNVLLAAVTFKVARRLASGANLAAVLAVVLVLSVRSIEVGSADWLFSTSPDPSQVALPLGLLSLWHGLTGRPWAGLAAAVPATLLHPVLGLQCGALGLGVCLLSGLVRPLRGRADSRPPGPRYWQPAAGLALFLVFYAAVWLVPLARQDVLGVISPSEFLSIHSRFRLPHHIIPSYFPLKDYLALAAFLVAGFLSWSWHRRQAEDRGLSARIAAAVVIVLLSWLAGYVFVEVVPTRFVASLQTFRLVTVVKWFGLVMLGGTIARLWSRSDEGRAMTGAMLFLPAGFAHPHAMLWGHVGVLARRRLRGRSPAARAAVLTLMLLVAAGIVFFGGMRSQEFLALLATGSVGAALLFGPRRGGRIALAVLPVLLVTGLILVNRQRPIGPLARLLRGTEPRFTLAEVSGPMSEVATFVRSSTPGRTVLLAPPMWDMFRILAERPVVVDFRNFPFDDRAMLEWRQRMADCYGEVTTWGFYAGWEMNANYRRITEARIRAVARRYGAEYAVLYKETPCRFEVMHENETHKVVAIPEEISIVVFRDSPAPPAAPRDYYRALAAARREDAVIGATYTMPGAAGMTLENARARYRAAVTAGELDELGEALEPFSGPDPEGARAVVLFFRSGRVPR